MDYMIIVAAGSGSRYGGDLPKQFCELNGRPLLMTTLERLHALMPECRLVVTLSEDMRAAWEDMQREAGFTLSHYKVTGGATRALSVRNAIDFIARQPGEKRYIGVHDAARAAVSKRLIDGLLEALDSGEADGAVPACRLSDSLRIVEADGRSEARDRTRFRTVQTPQMFEAAKLIEANGRLLPPDTDAEGAARFTDDASVMEAAGYGRLVLTDGDPHNIKVTNPGDMAVAELYLSQDPL